MGRIFTQTINRFDGGVSNDPRVNIANKYTLLRNFDPFTYPNKLVPRGIVEAKETKALNIVKFLYATRGIYGNCLFGLGIVAGSSKAAIYYWDGSAWQTPANNESGAGSRSEDVFFKYKGYAYTWGGGTSLKRFDLDSGDAFNDTYQSIGYTNVIQPVHHKSDDCAYFFADNYVHRLNGTVFDGGTTTPVLTLPDDEYITAASQHGNYLSIATVSTDGLRSTIYLWDRSATIDTISERYDFGCGSVIHLAEMGGKLTAVLASYPKIIIKQLYGGTFETTQELISNSTSGFLAFSKTSVFLNDKFYFPMDLDADGGDRMGIWAINESGKITLDYAIDDATSYRGLFTDGIYLWIAHSSDGSVDRINLNSTLNTETAVYETLIVGDPTKNYKLISAGVSVSPTTGDFTLKYKKKESDAWITIFTCTENYIFFHEAINHEVAGTGIDIGDDLPEFIEMYFRAESENGAIITGVNIKIEELDNNIS